MRLDFRREERLPIGGYGAGEGEVFAGPARGGDRALRPLDRVHPSDKDQALAAFGRERPLVEVDGIRYDVTTSDTLRGQPALRMTERHQSGLMPLAAVELHSLVGERPVNRVYERLAQPAPH